MVLASRWLWWLWWLLAAAGTQGLELTEEEYYELPRLFEMDDMAQCLSRPQGLYCLGSYTLHADGRSPLLHTLQQYSLESHHFNRTLLHRGYCVSSRCGSPGPGPVPAGPVPVPAALAAPAPARFERCVSDTINKQYGLRARLVQLDHCTSSEENRRVRPLDTPEIVFAALLGLILLANLVGTVYDVCRNKDGRPNPYLLAWSLRSSWGRLTADHSISGDPRLNALAPVQGVRVMILMVVMMAHSVLGHYMTYIYNPDFLERSHLHLLAMLIRNGTMVVQAFFVLSAFLLAYNLLLLADNEKKAVDLRMLPGVLLHRVIRIAPMHMMAVGLQATWWARSSSGPLWGRTVAAEADVCRHKWWTHFLFINNLVHVDEMCLLPSWFLAADMQVYVVCAALTLLLARRRRLALPVLAALLTAAIVGNYVAAYYYHLQPMVKVISPEMMRAQYITHSSFKWLYAAAWGSFPSGLIGLALAFLYKHLRDIDYPLHEKKMFGAVYRVSFYLLVGWILSGVWWQHLEQPAAVAAYAAIERPVFAIGSAIFLLGIFYGIRGMALGLCGSSAWRVLARLALGVLLLHWPHSQGLLANRETTTAVFVPLVGGHLLTTMFMTYWSALLAYLLLEAPAQRFLQLVFFSHNK